MVETSAKAAVSVTQATRSALALIAEAAWFSLLQQLLLMVQQTALGSVSITSSRDIFDVSSIGQQGQTAISSLEKAE